MSYLKFPLNLLRERFPRGNLLLVFINENHPLQNTAIHFYDTSNFGVREAYSRFARYEILVLVVPNT